VVIVSIFFSLHTCKLPGVYWACWKPPSHSAVCWCLLCVSDCTHIPLHSSPESWLSF
jgi:hypothetical protein